MMKWKLVVALSLVSGGLLMLPGCTGSKKQKAELEQVKSALQATERQRDALKTDVAKLSESLDRTESELADVNEARNGLQRRLSQLEEARAQLQSKAEELTTSRDALQTQVEDLVTSRGQLQAQVDGLTAARDAALVDAKKAQAQIDKLNGQLQLQARQVTDLKTQITAIRAVLGQLQEKLQ